MVKHKVEGLTACGKRYGVRSLTDQANALWAQSNKLTFAQCEALVAWRYAYGRSWKLALWSAWQRHDYRGIDERHSVELAGLRNHSDFGPRWLARFSFKDGHSRA